MVLTALGYHTGLKFHAPTQFKNSFLDIPSKSHKNVFFSEDWQVQSANSSRMCEKLIFKCLV